MDDFCPNCKWGPLQQGELSDGNIIYTWEYCNDCRWQGEITRSRILRYDWGYSYKIDLTTVRPDIALFRMLRGRLQLTNEDASEKQLSPSGHPILEFAPSAPCPQCRSVIQQSHRPCEDLSGYQVFWSCQACGFETEPMNSPAPGLFTHSEGYRWISWRGKPYQLTSNQTKIVTKLHVSFLNGAADVHQGELLDEIGLPSSRVRDSFRSANRELWGTLIVHAVGARRGSLRINL
jgi:hypothetical protein